MRNASAYRAWGLTIGGLLLASCAKDFATEPFDGGPPSPVDDSGIEHDATRGEAGSEDASEEAASDDASGAEAGSDALADAQADAQADAEPEAGSEAGVLVPTMGLVGEWLCTGNTNDTSSNGNNGTATQVTFVADRHGTSSSACSFNGSSSHVEVANAASLGVTTTWSVSAWVQPASFSTLAGIVSKYQNTGTNGFTVRLSYASPYTGIDVDETTKSGGTTGLLTAKTWSHVAVTVNGTSVQCYIDGALAYSSSAGYAAQASVDPLELGVDYLNGGNARYFNGAIDDVRLYNRVLAATEIQALYAAP
jgi:hypothetical protein